MDDDTHLDPNDFEWTTRADIDPPPTQPAPDSADSTDSGALLSRVSRPRFAAVGVAALLVMSLAFGFSGGAAADTVFTAANVDVTSHSGQLTALEVAPAGHIHYRGFEQPASSVTVTVAVKKSSATTWEQIDSKTITASGLAGNASYDFTTIDVLASSSLSRQDFRAADGDTKSTDVDVRVAVTFADAGPGGSDVTSSSMDTFTVNVTNIKAGGGVGGNANTNGN